MNAASPAVSPDSTNTAIFTRPMRHAREPAGLGVSADRKHVPSHDRVHADRCLRRRRPPTITSIGTG